MKGIKQIGFICLGIAVLIVIYLVGRHHRLGRIELAESNGKVVEADGPATTLDTSASRLELSLGDVVNADRRTVQLVDANARHEYDLTINIVDSDGHPIPNAFVDIWFDSYSEGTASELLVESDTSGQVNLRSLSSNQVWLGAMGDSTEAHVFEFGVHNIVTIEVSRASGHLFRILDNRQVPIEGASILISGMGQNYLECCSNALGYLSLSNSVSGQKVQAIHPGYLPSRSLQLVKSNADEMTRYLILENGLSAEARIEVRMEGQPISGVLISLLSQLSNSEINTLELQTNSDGIACISGLPPGTYAVYAVAPSVGIAWTSIQLMAGARSIELIHLIDGVFVTGSVVDRMGSPVPGVSVEAVQNCDEVSIRSHNSRQFVETTVDGEFTFDSLFPVATQFVAQDGLNRTGVETKDLGNGNQHALEIVLSSGNQLLGSVTDGIGDPLEGFLVGIPNPIDPNLWDCMAVVDEEGHFAISNVPNGAEVLEVRTAKDGWGPIVHRQDVDIENGPVHLVLDLASALSSGIIGRIAMRDDGAHGSFFVAIRKSDLDPGMEFSFSSSTHDFNIGSLPEGDYRLQIAAENAVRHMVDIRLQANQTLDLGTLALIPAGSLTCKVIGSESIQERMRIKVIQVGGEKHSFQMRVSSAVAIGTNLPPGEYAVSLWAGQVQLDSLTTFVQARSNVEVILAAD